jgi:hypothetical protein
VEHRVKLLPVELAVAIGVKRRDNAGDARLGDPLLEVLGESLRDLFTRELAVLVPSLSVSISSNVSFATVACLSFSIATAAFLLLAPAPIVNARATLPLALPPSGARAYATEL